MSFSSWAGGGFGPSLLPIIPPDAEVSDFAGPNVAANRGKIPGRLALDGWVGFANWTEHRADADDHEKWDRWGAGVGLQTRDYPALDIDVEDEALARQVAALAVAYLGFAPARTRANSQRRLILFRTNTPFPKLRLSLGPAGAVEMLGDGQQCVVGGSHPSGAAYEWRRQPVADDLTTITAAEVEAFFDRLFDLLDMLGYEPTRSGVAQRDVADVPEQDALRAPSLDAIRDALSHVPNDVDYDTWLKSGRACKAAGGEEAFDVWLEWSLSYPGANEATITAKWESFRAPHRIGWAWLSAWARKTGGFVEAVHLFEPVAEAPVVDPLADMFRRYVWVEELKRAYDTDARRLLDKEQFNVALRHIGPPSSAKNSAWGRWQASQNLRAARSATYLPGHEPVIGDRVNTWVPSGFTPVDVTECDIKPWLDHLAAIYSDPDERAIMLDWFAFVLQKQDKKPPFALVMGSTHEGVGKDIALRPIHVALGSHNISTVSPDQILSQYTDWAESARLVVAEEMATYGKRETNNRLKIYLASPPVTVPISKKFMPKYEIPNLFAVLFLTNNANALPISKEDRRYFVLWTEREPLPASHYKALAEWYDQGGDKLVASWLLKRDLTAMLKLTVAPVTAAKVEMQKLALSPMEAWLDEGIREGSGPFAADLVDAADIIRRLPSTIKWEGATIERMGSQLRKYGARLVGKFRLSDPLPSTASDRVTIYSVRRHEMYATLEPGKITELFLKQRNTEAEFKAVS
jgi:hypothetical protein